MPARSIATNGNNAKLRGVFPMTGGPSKANGFDANGNFYVGSGSLPPGAALTTGANNFLWGSRAGGLLTTGSNNVIMGLDAGLLMTTGGSTNPNFNVYIGYRAGSTSTEGGNIALGQAALGADAGATNTVYSGVAIGEFALNTVRTSQKDTAVGSYALSTYKRGGQQTAIGRGAGTNVQEGSYCFFAGHAAGFYHVAGVHNIFIGDSAGQPATMTGQPPRITASQSTTVLTVTAVTGGDASIAVGMVFASTTATGLASNITVTSLGTGSGGTGTYNVTPSQTVASQTMIGGAAGDLNIVLGYQSGSVGYSDASNIIVGNSISMASASNMTVIGKGQTAATISGNLISGSNVASVTAANGTWTAAQMRGGLIIHTTQAATNVTTPTAAQIVAAIPGCEVGSTIWFDVKNMNSSTLTIVAADGTVTLNGTTAIATVFTRRYMARVTNATASSEAVTLYGLSTAAN